MEGHGITAAVRITSYCRARRAYKTPTKAIIRPGTPIPMPVPNAILSLSLRLLLPLSEGVGVAVSVGEDVDDVVDVDKVDAGRV